MSLGVVMAQGQSTLFSVEVYKIYSLYISMFFLMLSFIYYKIRISYYALDIFVTIIRSIF